MGSYEEHKIKLKQSIWEQVDNLQELDKEITEEEIKEAINGLAQDKASDPDGFLIFFYKKFWELIMVFFFMRLVDEVNLDKVRWYRLNYAQIVLIPKISNLVKIRDYRPISLLNSTVKIISKVLANRLVAKLQDLVEEE